MFFRILHCYFGGMNLILHDTSSHPAPFAPPPGPPEMCDAHKTVLPNQFNWTSSTRTWKQSRLILFDRDFSFQWFLGREKPSKNLIETTNPNAFFKMASIKREKHLKWRAHTVEHLCVKARSTLHTQNSIDTLPVLQIRWDFFHHSLSQLKRRPSKRVTSHSPLHTSHSPRHTSHSTRSSHFTLRIPHFTLRTSLSTLHTPLHTSHFTLHTSLSTLQSRHFNSTLHASQPPLHNQNILLQILETRRASRLEIRGTLHAWVPQFCNFATSRFVANPGDTASENTSRQSATFETLKCHIFYHFLSARRGSIRAPRHATTCKPSSTPRPPTKKTRTLHYAFRNNQKLHAHLLFEGIPELDRQGLLLILAPNELREVWN